MEATAGMVDELVRIRHDSTDSGPKPLKNLNGQICQICGDTAGFTANGDIFVACNECAFPVCRPCYEYERKDGNQCCPQCKTRYKRHKGSPRVDGDDDEDDVDDIENEFQYVQGTGRAMKQWQGEDADLSSSSRHDSQQPIPLLTNGQPFSGEVPCATPDTQSVRTTSGPLGPSEKVHSLPYIDPRQPVPVRIVDEDMPPDLAATAEPWTEQHSAGAPGVLTRGRARKLQELGAKDACIQREIEAALKTCLMLTSAWTVEELRSNTMHVCMVEFGSHT